MDSMSESSGWSTSDDSDIEELLEDDDTDMTVALVVVNELQKRAMLLDRRQGSQMGHTYIFRNHALGHEQLIQDYFAEVPTYPPRLFRRRYRMRRDLFVKIVKDCEAMMARY
jgi:hypothetical protein